MLRTSVTVLLLAFATAAQAQQPAPPTTYKLEGLTVEELTSLGEGIAARQRELVALIGKIRQQIAAQEAANAKPPAPAPAPAPSPDPPKAQ